MEYNEFLSYIKDSITAIIGNERKVNIHKIIKNNDIELDGLTIMSSETNISPTIYLNDYYKDYLNGTNIGDIVYDIYGLYEQQNHKLDFDLSFFSDFSQIKERLMFKLINFDANKKLLSEVPYIKYLDLAIVFYCFIENDTLGDATVLIHTNHMDIWDVKPDELYNYAIINTPITLPPVITNMNEIIRELIIDKLQHEYIIADTDDYDVPFEDMADSFLNIINNKEQPSMYILTNTHRSNGSACILYKDVLKQFSVQFNSDLFIIPSSIHEVILIPYSDDISPEQLNEMVKDINTKEVDAIEVLSNHIYRYDSIANSILML